MALRSRFAGMMVLIVVTAGCSHGTVTALPTAPTAPTVTVRRLTVTPSGGMTLIAGQNVEMSSAGPFVSNRVAVGAFAEYTDGSGNYVEAIWTSSDASVLAVSSGSLRAMKRGTATLTAAAVGHTASETFTVEPGIPGTWGGTYVVDLCTGGSGSIHELVCNATPGRQPGILQPGIVAPINLQITQSGTDLSATAAFGEVRGALKGSDRGQNLLTLTGNLTGGTTTISVVYWDARVKTDVMEGFIAFEVRMAGIASYAHVTAHLVDVTRRQNPSTSAAP